MEKLYDLMIMCLKYQIFHTRSAVELHAITLNHLDSLERMVANPQVFFENLPNAIENYIKPKASENNKTIQECFNLIKQAKQNYIHYYNKFSNLEFEFIKTCLNKLLEKSMTRISMFLRAKVQDDKGNFVYDAKFAQILLNQDKSESTATDINMPGSNENSGNFRTQFKLVNQDIVDVCYRGSFLGNSLYHIFGRNSGSETSPKNETKSISDMRNWSWGSLVL